jgi:hypothetical protein
VTAAPDPTFRLILDAYSPLSHKHLIGDGRQVVTPTTLIHSWVPLHERRRLAAYLILDAYRKNSVRIFLGRASLLEQADHREYGDVQLILGRIAHGVLGDDFEITVEGADDDLGDAPDLPEAPVDPGPEATPIEARIYAIQQSRYDDAAATAVDEWEQKLGNQPLLAARQDDLRDWADRIGLAALLVEGEADCVALGDTVYALWPQTGGWPEVRRYDPDAYFPILEDDLEGFPDKVHLAWEFEETTPDGVCERYLRRLTWELVPIDVIDPVTREVLGAGAGTRPMPWAEEGDEPATQTCVFSEGVWPLGTVGGPTTTTQTSAHIPDLSEEAAIWEVDEAGVEQHNVDLGIDFLPVIHIPNTPASRTHYGQSSIAVVAQILDDLGQSDTDLMEVARLVAGPAIALSGAQMPAPDPMRNYDPERSWSQQAETGSQLQIRPLAVFELGETGSMTVMDLSAGLDKMMAFGNRLEDRLLVNARIPKALVGKVSSAQAASGVALLIDAAPFAEVIGNLRMTRDPKLQLMLRQVQKLAMLQGVIETGPIPKARVAFGSFLPMDRGAVVTEVAALFTAKLISRITAIRLLMAAGFEIEDAKREVQQIEADDVEGAKIVADATGSEQAAADRLGITLPEKPKPPEITLPPPPNQPPPPGNQSPPGPQPPNQ